MATMEQKRLTFDEYKALRDRLITEFTGGLQPSILRDKLTRSEDQLAGFSAGMTALWHALATAHAVRPLAHLPALKNTKNERVEKYARAFAASTGYPKGARALMRDLLAILDDMRSDR